METQIEVGTRPSAPAGNEAGIVTMFGATTCEDTALVRSRLEFAGIPYVELDIDVDQAAADRLARLTGARSTPTLVLPPQTTGAGTIVSEPSLDRLDALLDQAGFGSCSPSVVRFHGETAERPIPFRTVSTSLGGRFSLEEVRLRRQVALFLGHDAACLACMGYAKQLERQARQLADSDAIAIAAISDVRGLQPIAIWHREIGPDLTILIDRAGEWKRSVLAAVGHPDAGTALLILDRFAAPQAGSFGPEAGFLANPSQAAEWLAFAALACPECSIELPWPEPVETGAKSNET